MDRMRRAGWLIADYEYFVRRQFHSALRRNPLSATARRSGGTTDPDRPASPILILPGVYESWRFLLPIIEMLRDDGHPVHVVTPLRGNRMPVLDGARLVEDYLMTNDLTDVVLVAHSKGGLVGKRLMTEGPGAPRIRSMVAIASPFGGSRLARFMPSRGLRALAPSDPTIIGLGRARDANSRIVSIYPSFDPHIPEGSELAGATNLRVDTGGHFRILREPQVIAAVRRVAAGEAPVRDDE